MIKCDHNIEIPTIEKVRIWHVKAGDGYLAGMLEDGTIITLKTPDHAQAFLTEEDALRVAGIVQGWAVVEGSITIDHGKTWHKVQLGERLAMTAKQTKEAVD